MLIAKPVKAKILEEAGRPPTKLNTVTLRKGVNRKAAS
jgi:hypothetical protein